MKHHAAIITSRVIASLSLGFSLICHAAPLPAVSIVETKPATTEGDYDNPARLTLIRTGDTASSLEVLLSIGGTATPGADYPPIPSSITIPAGQLSREIAIRPYEDSLPEGSESIIVTITPDSGYTVASPNTATVIVLDSPFDAWRFLHFTPAQLADPEISGPTADPDSDSTPNIGEFFAGSDPLTYDLGPHAELVESEDLFHLSIRRHQAASWLAVSIEKSSDLSEWQPLTPQPPMSVENLDDWDYLSFPIADAEESHRFWRARISRLDPPPNTSYDYYVDANNGSDANDGLSPGTAFATISQALAASSSNRSASIGLARGSRYTPPSSFTFNITGRWGAYGFGHMPFIDCSLPVDVEITEHPTHPNVYVAEITHAVEPFYSGHTQSSLIASNGPHVGLWLETEATGMFGEYITPVFGLSDTDTSEQFIADNPGRVFVQKVGSSLTDVRLESSGNTLRYTFQLPDGSDPRNGGSLRYACYHSTGLSFNPGARVTGLAFGRNTRKDCLSANNTATTPSIDLPLFTACAWLDPGCHALVGSSHWHRCLAYSRTSGSMVGGGWHNYTGVYEPRIPTIFDCLISGFGNAIYSHGSSQSPVLQSMEGARLVIERSNKAFDIPSVSSPASFEDVRMIEVRGIMAGQTHLKRFSAGLTGRFNSSFVFHRAPAGVVEDGVIDFDQIAMSSSNRVISGSNNNTQAAGEALGTPTIRRITFAKSPLRAALQTTNLQKYIAFIFEDSVVGSTVRNNNADSEIYINSATIKNCYIGPIKTNGLALLGTLAEYQEKVPGAEEDVILYEGTLPVTFAGDPLVDPTITGPPGILGKGMGVDPQIILDLPSKLTNVPTLQSMGFAP